MQYIQEAFKPTILQTVHAINAFLLCNSSQSQLKSNVHVKLTKYLLFSI